MAAAAAAPGGWPSASAGAAQQLAAGAGRRGAGAGRAGRWPGRGSQADDPGGARRACAQCPVPSSADGLQVPCTLPQEAAAAPAAAAQHLVSGASVSASVLEALRELDVLGEPCGQGKPVPYETAGAAPALSRCHQSFIGWGCQHRALPSAWALPHDSHINVSLRDDGKKARMLALCTKGSTWARLVQGSAPAAR